MGNQQSSSEMVPAGVAVDGLLRKYQRQLVEKERKLVEMKENHEKAAQFYRNRIDILSSAKRELEQHRNISIAVTGLSLFSLVGGGLFLRYGTKGGAAKRLQQELNKVKQAAHEQRRSNLEEIEAVRQRSADQLSSEKKFVVKKFGKELLDTMDNLERAVGAFSPHNKKSMVSPDPNEDSTAPSVTPEPEALVEGIQMTTLSFQQTLENNGIHKMSPLGNVFDPHFHEAVSQVTLEEAKNMFEPPAGACFSSGCVAHVIQDGYMVHDKVLRAARVVVIEGPKEHENVSDD